MTQYIPLLGYTLVSLKILFDSKSILSKQNSKSQILHPEQVCALFLELGLPNEVFSKSRSYMKRLELDEVDFSTFIQLYAKYSGIERLSLSNSNNSSENERITIVPTLTGFFDTISYNFRHKILKEALPLAIEADQVNDLSTNKYKFDPMEIYKKKDSDLIFSNENYFFSLSDLEDIFILCGFIVDMDIVNEVVKKFKHFISYYNEKVVSFDVSYLSFSLLFISFSLSLFLLSFSIFPYLIFLLYLLRASSLSSITLFS